MIRLTTWLSDPFGQKVRKERQRREAQEQRAFVERLVEVLGPIEANSIEVGSIRAD